MRVAILLVPLLLLAACWTDGLTANLGDLSTRGGSSRDGAVLRDLAGIDLVASPPRPDDRCGGWGGRSCPPDQFCNIPFECGFADGSGTCALRPQFCPAVEDPVCGCDGRQYGNACACNAAGVSVHYFGACGCTVPCGPGDACAPCHGKLVCIAKGADC